MSDERSKKTDNMSEAERDAYHAAFWWNLNLKSGADHLGSLVQIVAAARFGQNSFRPDRRGHLLREIETAEDFFLRLHDCLSALIRRFEVGIVADG